MFSCRGVLGWELSEMSSPAAGQQAHAASPSREHAGSVDLVICVCLVLLWKDVHCCHKNGLGLDDLCNLESLHACMHSGNGADMWTRPGQAGQTHTSVCTCHHHMKAEAHDRSSAARMHDLAALQPLPLGTGSTAVATSSSCRTWPVLAGIKPVWVLTRSRFPAHLCC